MLLLLIELGLVLFFYATEKPLPYRKTLSEAFYFPKNQAAASFKSQSTLFESGGYCPARAIKKSINQNLHIKHRLSPKGNDDGFVGILKIYLPSRPKL